MCPSALLPGAGVSAAAVLERLFALLERLFVRGPALHFGVFRERATFRPLSKAGSKVDHNRNWPT